ncbi:hypothetical protein E4T86_04390 [Mammaliicoccus sciuri]|uniref:hypothetical protein n=1 Tax=Mammaliicoccus sciuri TaxID=1296 RepID=UPI0010725FB5|nr:hypothetical protein [Mammaliicoccus sciuri]MBF0773265.1 hypothetical protein [Mammaliicoccus sciuri]TFU88285.1 hypothetical protein E4T86_04390 [Mammaliicoccus sciuri]
MAYEYEVGIIGMLGGVEDRHFIDLSDHKNELKEVYAKAKAFNEISDVIKKTEFYDRDTALDIIEIVEDLEDK